MRLLITGSTGLIGREVSSVAVKLRHDVYSAQHKAKPDFGIPIELDINGVQSIEKCFKSLKPDAVIHLAAFTDVDRCENEKELALETNARAVERIAKECGKYDCNLVHVSTDYVFDGEKGMYSESDRPNPINWYGESKLRGEEAVKSHAKDWCIARTSTPYGLHPSRKSFPFFVIEKLSSGKEVLVLQDQYTSPTYTVNLARMLIEIAERRLQGIIHVSGASRLSRLELARFLADKLALNKDLIRPITMSEMKWVAKRPRDSSLDVTKAKSILKQMPEQIEQSLEAFLQEFRSSGKMYFGQRSQT